MRIVPLVLVGHGGVGKAFLQQIEAYAKRHGEAAPNRFLTAAIITSRRIARWGGQELERPHCHEWECVPQIAREAELKWGTPAVVIDATSEENGIAHLRWVDEGFTVVSANKRPLNGPLWFFRHLTNAIDPRGHRSYWFEATVGAGLPVIRTVRELVETGDRIKRIDAVLSGTLNFLCSAHARGEPYGASVLAAVAKGLAEPDPRHDLKCDDVARKSMILARLAGMPLEDVKGMRIDGLLSGDLWHMDLEKFIASLRGQDRWPAPWPESGAFEYVVTIVPAEGRIHARLKPRNLGRPMLVGPENRFSITTERNGGVPVVIRGPGAGRDVTATAMFGDLLRSIARL